MRILWVKVGGLWPSTTGGRVRSLRTLSELAKRHEVTLVTTHGPGDDHEGLARQLTNCHQVVSIPYVPAKRGSADFPATVARSWLSKYPVDLFKWQIPAVRERVTALMESGAVDLCVADFLFAAVNVPFGGRTPVALFEHNVEYMIWRRLCALERNPVKRALFELEWRKLRAREADFCAAADLTIAVSEDDRQRLEELAPGARMASIPTGVDTTYFAPGRTPEVPARLVFSGSMDWHPNEDAVIYFADTILPRIREQIPDVSFTIVGRNPSEKVRELESRPGIHVTGTVADVRPTIDEAALYVVPLRAGGGTRLKIFEALAMAKAVVSTTVGAEGLALVDGRQFVAADDPETFATSVISLLRDPGRRRALGRAGRELVDTHYSWPTIASEFESRLQETVNAVVAEVGTEHGITGEIAAGGAYLSRGGRARSRRPRVVAGQHHDVGWSHHHS